ncbi:hypothetical protein VMA_002684 [Vibrio mimicus VM223]|nr:hypothetical protein VMA_002684 [Vibrio mimicus VM223]
MLLAVFDLHTKVLLCTLLLGQCFIQLREKAVKVAILTGR